MHSSSLSDGIEEFADPDVSSIDEAHKNTGSLNKNGNPILINENIHQENDNIFIKFF